MFDCNVAAVAHLIAGPARAIILSALMDGTARPAGELAGAAGISAQTASSHLNKLVDGGLVAVEQQGRHRYYRLAGPQVAEALEQLGNIRPAVANCRRALSRDARGLEFARCCYDHLAGKLAVAITQTLCARGVLTVEADKRYGITSDGLAWFADLGLEVGTVRAGGGGIARQCLDWTERRHHLAGPLGVRLLRLMCERDWLRRQHGSRVVVLTARGGAELKVRLGIDADLIRAAV